MASMPVQAYDFKSNGLSYNIGDNKTVSVTRGGNYSGDVVIPNSVDYNGNSYSVTSIEENAFNNCNGMTSIIIPNSVMTIGKYAFFACRGLDSVNIPYGVTYIGDNAFSCCDNITNISIPNSVTYIGEYAFWECKFKSISIPSSVRYIGDHVF